MGDINALADEIRGICKRLPTPDGFVALADKLRENSLEDAFHAVQFLAVSEGRFLEKLVGAVGLENLQSPDALVQLSARKGDDIAIGLRGQLDRPILRPADLLFLQGLAFQLRDEMDKQEALKG